MHGLGKGGPASCAARKPYVGAAERKAALDSASIINGLAEWSKALASGASPEGRGLEPHSRQCPGRSGLSAYGSSSHTQKCFWRWMHGLSMGTPQPSVPWAKQPVGLRKLKSNAEVLLAVDAWP